VTNLGSLTVTVGLLKLVIAHNYISQGTMYVAMGTFMVVLSLFLWFGIKNVERMRDTKSFKEIIRRVLLSIKTDSTVGICLAINFANKMVVVCTFVFAPLVITEAYDNDQKQAGDVISLIFLVSTCVALPLYFLLGLIMDGKCSLWKL
jgi:hypothetical protein